MTDAYKIGVTVALTNLVSAELGRIVTHFMHAQRAADGLKTSLLGLGGVGVAGALVAVGVVMKAGFEEARKFQNELTKFAALGFGDKVSDQAQRFAKGMKTIGTSASENMSLVADAMAVFKNLGHAEMAAPLMAQMKFANEAVYGEEGGARESKFMDMLKVIEFRGGLKNDAEFRTQANFVQKVIDGSRNRVDATQLLNALKTGGVALAGMSNEGFYLGSEPLIQEFGGYRYGTANMSIYQNLVQMRTTQQALSELFRLGLIDPSKAKVNKYTGKVKRAKPGAFRGGHILTKEGDLAFLEKVLLPAFRAHGITSDDQIIMELGTILTNRRGSSLLARVYQQRGILQTQMDANKNAMDIGQLESAADQKFDGKVIELKTEWAKLMLQMDVMLPFVTKMTGWLIDIVKALQLDSAFSSRVGGFMNARLAEDKSMFDSVKGLFNFSKGGSSGALGAPPSASQQPIVLHNTTTLDGRIIAQSTTQYQVDGMAGAPSQGSAFNGRMSLVPVH